MPHLVKALPDRFTGREAKVDDIGELHAIARDWYSAKLVSGGDPLVVAGGALDGLRYFEVLLGGVRYWITGSGLFDPR